MQNHDLFMTAEEQRGALESGGFKRVERVLMHQGLVLHRAE